MSFISTRDERDAPEGRKSSVGDREAQGLDTQRLGLVEQIRLLREEVRLNRTKLEAFEGRMSFMDQPRRAFSAQDQGNALTEITDDYPDDAIDDYMVLTAKNTIPEVRECAFAEFKNRFEPNGEDGCYAVDVLVSGPLLA